MCLYGKKIKRHWIQRCFRSICNLLTLITFTVEVQYALQYFIIALPNWLGNFLVLEKGYDRISLKENNLQQIH